jgi:hypothetical protein
MDVILALVPPKFTVDAVFSTLHKISQHSNPNRHTSNHTLLHLHLPNLNSQFLHLFVSYYDKYSLQENPLYNNSADLQGLLQKDPTTIQHIRSTQHYTNCLHPRNFIDHMDSLQTHKGYLQYFLYLRLTRHTLLQP